MTFCTYSLLDFEVHSTPLVSGSQPKYSFTSRYALTARDLGKLGGQGSKVRVELHQALGGVRFVTHGSGQMSLMGAMTRRGERIVGRINITGESSKKKKKKRNIQKNTVNILCGHVNIYDTMHCVTLPTV